MIYIENALFGQEYISLRKSVGWDVFSEHKTAKILANNLYSVVAICDNETVGMGRVIGDGLYFVLVDIIVKPVFQKMGIGSHIVDMLLRYVEGVTPVGERSSVQLIAERGKEPFYEKKGFKIIPSGECGHGMRKIICK